MKFVIVIALVSWNASTLSSTNSREDELRQKVVRLLKPTHVLDLAEDTLNVTVDIIIDSVTDLKILRMEFEVRLRLFLTWELNEDMLEICHMEAESVGASRLSLDHGEIILATDDLSLIWVPQIYFEEAKLITVPSEIVKPLGIRYFRDGPTSRYYKEFCGTFVIIVGCNLDLKRFPFDTHVCPLTIRSFSHRNHEVGIYPGEVVVDNDLGLSEYYLSINLSSREIQHPLWEGVFQGAQMSFRFARRLPHQFIIMYFPSLLVVGVASLSWLLPLRASVERLTLIITVTLVMYTQLGKIRSSVPTTSYVTYGDIWLFCCTLFVFGVTVECAVMEGLYEILNRRKYKIQATFTKVEPYHDAIPATISYVDGMQSIDSDVSASVLTRRIRRSIRNLPSPRQKLTLRKFHGTRRAPETDGNIDPVEAWDRRIRKAMVAAFSLTAVVYWILMLVEMNAV